MLGKERAVAVVDELHKVIRALVRQDYEPSDRSGLDRLADATVSLEYYMETLQAGRSEPQFMLDNAERCLAGLLSQFEERPEAAPGEKRFSATDIAATMVIPRGEVAAIAPPAGPAPPAQVHAAGSERIDPELLELFIEEAREEIGNIGQAFAAWERNEADTTALVSLRRSFHTLKGSGRTVGAERIGDYCWIVERLLNRAINGTLGRSTQMLETCRAPSRPCPSCWSSLRSARSAQRYRCADGKSAGIRRRPGDDRTRTGIHVARSREPGESRAEASSAVEEIVIAASPMPVAPAMEPVLLDILSREVRGHLDVIARYIASSQEHSPPFAVPEELYRACHTLHGSMAMARAPVGLSTTEAMNHLVSVARERQSRLSAEMISALGAAASAVETALRYLADAAEPQPGTAVLEAQLRGYAGDLELQAPAELATPPANCGLSIWI